MFECSRVYVFLPSNPQTPKPLNTQRLVSNRVLLAVTLLLLWPLAGCSSLVQSLQNQECALQATRPFDVVEIDLDRHELRLFWKQPDGSPFLTLDRVQAWAAAQGDSLIAATSGEDMMKLIRTEEQGSLFDRLRRFGGSK